MASEHLSTESHSESLTESSHSFRLAAVAAALGYLFVLVIGMFILQRQMAAAHLQQLGHLQDLVNTYPQDVPIDLAMRLVDYGYTSRGLVDALDSTHATPLIHASAAGDLEAIRYLLAKGATPALKDQSGRTSLHYAAEYGDTAACALMYAPPLLNNTDNYGMSPLLWAVKANQIPAALWLLRQGAEVGITNQDGNTALHYAAGLGEVEFMRALLDRGADPNSTTRVQSTPLHWAAKEGQEVALALLLQEGAEKNFQNKFGLTALHYAVQNGNLEAVRVLLNKRASRTRRDNDGLTPLDYARKREDQRMIDLLNS